MTPRPKIQKTRIEKSREKAINIVAYLLKMNEFFIKERKYKEVTYGKDQEHNEEPDNKETKINIEIERVYYKDFAETFNCRFAIYHTKNEALQIEDFVNVEKRIVNEMLNNHLVEEIEPDDPDLVKLEGYKRWLNNFKHPSQIKDGKYIDKRLESKDIALIYIYNGNTINRENCKLIASKYGFVSNNSGFALLQDYQGYLKKSDRINSPGNKRSLNKMMNRISKIIPLLENEDAQQTAFEELALLEKKY